MIPENRGVSALPLAPSQTRASCDLGALPAPQRPRQEHFRDLGVAPTARPTPDSLQGQEALLSNHVLCLRCRNGWQVISADRGAGAVGCMLASGSFAQQEAVIALRTRPARRRAAAGEHGATPGSVEETQSPYDLHGI